MAVKKSTDVANQIRKEILAGRYGSEGGLPEIREIAKKSGVALNTVVAALSNLEGQGLIEKRGHSYYVNSISFVMTQYVPPAHVRLHRGGYCKNMGPIERVPLPEHLAEKLHSPQSELVVYRVQISGELIEGKEKPSQISYRYHLLPISDEKIQRMQADATYDPMWGDTDIPAELVSHDEVTSRLATEEERNLLNLPETTPITNVFESIRDKSDTLLMAQDIILSPRATLIFDFPFTNRP